MPNNLLNLELFDIILIFSIIFIALIIGIWGYNRFARLDILDSFLNASMILSGMGPVDILRYREAKVFAGIYALFCGLIIIALVAYIISKLLMDAKL